MDYLYSLCQVEGIKSLVLNVFSLNHPDGDKTNLSGYWPSQAPHQEKLLLAMI